MPRPSRGCLALKLKKQMLRATAQPECAACSWSPPARFPLILNAHHIIPVQCDGTDEPDNLILLCPNCHALAHALDPLQAGRYRGPQDRAVLIAALRDPDTYLRIKKRQAVAKLDHTPTDTLRALPNRRSRGEFF